MPGKLPYFPFYPDDWLSDERLRLCSLAARGLWMDILSVMHKCDRRGFLHQANGKPFSKDHVARITGITAEMAGDLLQELIDAGVASVDERGVVFSKRMVHDEHLRQVRSQAGSKGGRKTGDLLKQKVKQKSSKHPSKTLEVELGVDHSSGETLKGDGGAGKGDEGFAEFWAAYPRKVAKPDAIKVWHKLRPDQSLRAAILSALEKQKRWDDWTKDDGRFIPYPASWLNAEGWNNQLPTPEPAARNGSGRGETLEQRIARIKEQQL